MNDTSPPYASYAALLSTFVAGVGGVAALARRTDRQIGPQDVIELSVLSLAVFKAARTLTHDEVTSFVREPFVLDETINSDEEKPIPNGGPRQAIGELVTCSRCVGVWVAAGILGVNTAAPRFGRVLTSSLAVAGINDVLQASFSALTGLANRMQP